MTLLRSDGARDMRVPGAVRGRPQPGIAHRIVFVTNGLARGGAETQLLHLARGFVDRGDEVGILSILPGVEFPEVESLALPVACTGTAPGARGLGAIVAGARVLRTWAPDTVVSFVYQANVLGRCAGHLARVPTIVSSVRNEFFGGRARELVMRVTDPLATITTTNSHRAAAGLVARGIVPASRLVVIPNGLDVEGFRRPAGVRSRVRMELGVEAADFVWIAVGRLEEQKDYPTLLRAVAMLSYPRPTLVVAGTGSQRPALQALAARLGITARVRFLGLRDDVPDLLAGADALVLSSSWEGSPNAVLEAMAAARPVVATDVGGVRELVESGRTGLVVARGDPAAIAHAMGALMALPDEDRAAMGRRARGVIERDHSLGAMHDGWVRLLERSNAFTVHHTRAATRAPLSLARTRR